MSDCNCPNKEAFSKSEREVYARALNCLDKEPFNLAMLRRLGLLLTQAHWSHVTNYGELQDNLKCLVYDENDPKSLTIRLDSDFQEDEAFKNPSIFVGVDRVAYSKQMQNARVSEKADFSGTDYSWKSMSTLRISHYHSEADIAFLMGDNTMTFYMGIREPLMDRLGLYGLDPIDVGPLQIIDKSPDRCYRVDAKMLLTYPTNITTYLESHRLKQFRISANPV